MWPSNCGHPAAYAAGLDVTGSLVANPGTFVPVGAARALYGTRRSSLSYAKPLI